ncbi:MAG: Uncharacterized protein CEN92_84 [Candidatus Berkelbacteria bacterium Licking1014_96]|uniref:Uncharacterized protein n=1 Tax=Candidatus Berkelbacteria bacterium Licking1014_96 TaxID=2017149 RepID=A0A554LH19_9BACT|nr:MAG: Uncharacterized protein CEN92_84 [Candidatus Berkelbacteria bacterium Licking1014_96]
MRRLFNVALSLVVLFFFTALPVQTKAVPKSDYGHTAAVNAGNGIYTIYVEEGTPDYGTYTVATGANHPATIALGAPQSVLFGGSGGNARTTYLTVRSYNTNTEYTSNASVGGASPGYTQVDLDPYAGAVTTLPTSITSTWTVNTRNDLFSISQTVAVEGTTIDNSRVRVTTTIVNDSQPDVAFNFGVRYEWDIMIDGEDGSYAKTVDPYSSWYSTETETSTINMQQYQLVNDPANPIFYVNGSVIGPAFSPAPTTPTKLQFVDWPSVSVLAFDYTPTGKTIAGAGEHSAVTYFWGDTENNAITLGEGQSRSFTQYLFAPMAESNPSVDILPQTGSE